MKRPHKKGLKAYRVHVGHKLITLAPILGIPMSSLSLIENALMIPSLTLLRKYAAAFDLPVARIVELYGESESERDRVRR